MGLGFDHYRRFLEAFTHGLQEQHQDDLVSVVLFGSVARGTASPESDIDILIVLTRPESNEIWWSQRALLEKLAQTCPEGRLDEDLPGTTRVRHFTLSTEQARKNRHLYLDMTEEAVILFDRNGFFAGKLEEMRKRLKELGSRRVWQPDGSWYWEIKPDLKFGEEFEL
ncbi:MAG: nucleotidyltransferase domain-containing protein [Nitrospirae bacterium]|nr:nucleotidyltransferase domain-containing protein [Nitrospirota bacterium]